MFLCFSPNCHVGFWSRKAEKRFSRVVILKGNRKECTMHHESTSFISRAALRALNATSTFSFCVRSRSGPGLTFWEILHRKKRKTKLRTGGEGAYVAGKEGLVPPTLPVCMRACRVNSCGPVAWFCRIASQRAMNYCRDMSSSTTNSFSCVHCAGFTLFIISVAQSRGAGGNSVETSLF